MQNLRMEELVIYIIVCSVRALPIFKAQLPMHYKVSALSISVNHTMIQLDSNEMNNMQLVTICEIPLSLGDRRVLWQRPGHSPPAEHSAVLRETSFSSESSASLPQYSPSAVTNRG